MAHARLVPRLVLCLALACFLVFFWESQTVQAQSETQSNPESPGGSGESAPTAPNFHKTLLVVGPSHPLEGHAGLALEAARAAALDARYAFQYWAPEGPAGGRAGVSEAPSASDLQKRAFEIQLLTQSALMMQPRGLLFLVTDPTLFRPSVRVLEGQKIAWGTFYGPVQKNGETALSIRTPFHFGVDFYRTGTIASSILTDQHRPFCLTARAHDLIETELCRGFAEKTGAPALAFGRLGLAAFAQPGLLDTQNDEPKKFVLFLTSPELLPLLARSPIAYQLQVLVHQTARAQDAETRHWLSQFEGGLVVHSPVWAQTYLGVSSFLLGPRLNVQITGTHLAQATLREVAREAARENQTP